MTDIREAELVLLSPEKRDGVKPLPPTKDVTRRGLTLGSATTQCSTRVPSSRRGRVLIGSMTRDHLQPPRNQNGRSPLGNTH
jgi:hypothetical protein